MYTRRNYSFWSTFNWSKKPFIAGFIYSGFISFAVHLFKKNYGIDISIPWQPVSVLGITVGFYLGFKNNASYDRLWEARKIWGGIVNSSRTFGAAVISFVQGADEQAIRKRLIYRHIAWMTALRYQLRLPKEWEHTKERLTGKHFPNTVEKCIEDMENELRLYLHSDEMKHYTGKSNIAVQVLKHQSKELQALKDEGYIDDFRHIELYKLIAALYDDQGRSERIKNFPFPRQYASASLWQTIIFSVLIPFGLLNIFSAASENVQWMATPFSALIIWVFFLMEKIGDYSENPFEAGFNDTPITSISRSIEIDLRQMIDDENIPAAIQSENGYLM